MKRTVFGTVGNCRNLFLAAAFGMLWSVGEADSIVTLEGKTINGTIVRENAEEVVLNTPDYGELTFRKVKLKSINRSGGAGAPAPPAPGAPAPSTGAGNSNPFGGSSAPAPAGNSNPFGGSAPAGNSNPFGGSAPAGNSNPFGGAPAGNSNPFGGSAAPKPGNNPFGGAPAANSNPFAPKPAANASQPGPSASGQQEEAPKKVWNPDELPPRPSTKLPSVPIAWQAVLFEVSDPKGFRLTPQSNARTSAENELDFYFNGPSRIRTETAKAKIVVKNGKDFLRLNPRSQIQFRDSMPGETTVELLNGGFWVDLADAAEGTRLLVIETQNGIIRGTEKAVFRVSDALEQGIHIAVVEGSVEVQSKTAQVQRKLSAGEMFLVRPEGSVSDVAALDNTVLYENKGWEGLELEWFQEESRTRMGVGTQDPRDLVNRNQLTELVRNVGNAFRKYVADTGHIPTQEDGYTVLIQNTHGKSGWSGPYLEGVVPPVDSWGRPLRYTMREGQTAGQEIGVVYSLGEDARDNNGNPSADITELVLYYQVERSN